MKHKLSSLLLFSLLFASFSAFAQKYTGTLLGVVKDPSGAVVPNANITVRDTGTNFVRTAKTNSSGEYTVAEVPAGSYEVRAGAPSFKDVIIKDVEVHVSSNATVNVTLQPGATAEVVTVEAHAVQVETSTGAVGGVIGGQQVRELPLNGRNFVQLTTLMPGAAVAENFDNKNKGLLAGVDISFSGAPANANQWRVDGANNNDIGSQRTILIYPSVDAIEEFKILRNSYGPEYGGAGGAQVNIVTKGGSNAFHGNVYYFGRNDALNAKSYFLAPPVAGQPCPAGNLSCQKQKLRRNDYGYTIGGPVKKDRAFFFFSEEWNSERRGQPRKAWVPTAAERNGNFSDLANCGSSRKPPIDPATGNPFTGNLIPSNRLSTAGQAWLSQLPLPNVSDPCAGNTWIQAVNIPVNYREENVRGDLNITKNSVLTLRYTQDAWSNPTHSFGEGGLWGEQAFPAISDSWDQPGKVAIGKVTTTLSNTSVNDFSFSWSANRINLSLAGDTPGLNDTIKAAYPTLFPQSGKLHGSLTPEPLCWCGSPTGFLGHFGPWANGQDLYTWKDDFSKVMGRHTLKTGVYYSRNKKDEETGNDGGAAWGPTGYQANWNGTTNNPYGDFLLKGILWGYGENARNGKAQARWSDTEFYFGDSWKVKPRLTLEYGARWSFSPPVYDDANNYSSFRPELFKASLGSDPCNGIVVPKGNTGCAALGAKGGTEVSERSLAPSNYHLIAPRFGFAWDVFGTGKFALRGGVGQFFSRDPVGILVRVESNNAPVAVAPAPERTLDNPTGPGGFLLDFVPTGGPKQSIENSTNTANSWQWNLTTETELWKDTKLELGWVALRGIHLNSSTSLNQVAPSDRLTYINRGILGDSTQNNLLPFNPLTNGLIEWNHRGDSTYHSLQTMFSTKFSRNSTFQASYTWSKNLADTTLAYVDTTTGITDRYNPRVGRGAADFDRRHIFSANMVYNLPTFDGWNSFAKATLGGWETTTILSFFTGTGLRLTNGSINGACDTDLIADSTKADCSSGRFRMFSGNPWGIGNSAGAAASPNRTAGQPCYTNGSDRLQHLNTSAFTWDGFHLGGYANAGPGDCTGPGVQDVDFSIAKNWKLPFRNRILGEESRLQFRLESFNLFNHPMFRGTDTNFNMTGGVIKNGVISCAGDATLKAAPCALNNSTFGQAATPSNLGNREIQYALKLVF